MALQGLDLSWYQRGNYKTLIDNYAKDFVIVRSSFSKTVDSACDSIYQYAKSKGKKLGFYMFPLTSDGDARAVAEWNYNQVKGYIKQAIPCIDWETTGGHNIADVNWAYNFAKRFEELSGVKPVFYMNGSCEASYDWSKVVANNNGLWLAAWGANDGKDHGTPATKHWKVVALHQFTSRYAGQNLDADTFNGDGAAWDKYAGKSGSAPAPKPAPKPTPAPAKKSNEQIALEVIAGKWGNGDDRKNRLKKAGYDYDAIQKIVNQKIGATPVKTYYIVKPGDTLSGIAAKYGTTYQKLAQMNGIKDPNKIYPNQRIRVK